MQTRMIYVVLVAAIAACGSPKHAGDDGPDTDALVDCDQDGAQRCLGATYQTCSGGLWQIAVDCPLACVDSLGCVQCTPGQSFCKDGNVWSCDDEGLPLAEVQACTGQNTCVGGSCVDACLDAASSKSYIGCEYWAVDLDNAVEVWGAVGQRVGSGPNAFTISASTCTSVYSGQIQSLAVCYGVQGSTTYAFGLCDPPSTMGGPGRCPSGLTCGTQSVCVSDAQRSPFAIVVSNPQAKDVNVTVTGPGGQTITQVIAAGQVSAIKPQAGNAIPDQSVDGSVEEKRAYKVVSDLPIVAYQFNPLDNVNVFSNDASLLIPRTTFDSDYYVMTMATLDRRAGQTYGTNSYYGYLTIVAWQDGTQVTVTPTVATTASGSVQTTAAGAATTYTLDAFDVVQLQATGSGDLTGTHITSPNMSTFGVFGGHEATAFGETVGPDATHNSPNGPCCADHLEEMMFPSTTWGKTFAIARSQSRMTNESDVVRVMAQVANTNVTFTPAPISGTCPALNPGQFCEVKIAFDTEISSDQPILVGHFLQSAIWGYTGPGMGSSVGTGDPSMAIAAPTEQFRKDYALLVPAQYEASYVSIAAAATGGVTLDGVPVTLTPFGGGATHRAARVPLTAGQHKITCADGCGITVYGWSRSVSYMFAGGLDLKPIVIL